MPGPIDHLTAVADDEARAADALEKEADELETRAGALRERAGAHRWRERGIREAIAKLSGERLTDSQQSRKEREVLSKIEQQALRRGSAVSRSRVGKHPYKAPFVDEWGSISRAADALGCSEGSLRGYLARTRARPVPRGIAERAERANPQRFPATQETWPGGIVK